MLNRNFFILGLLITVFSTIINSLSLKSHRVQTLIVQDSDYKSLSFEYLDKELPLIPNITTSAMPLSVYKANYLFRAKRVSEAKVFIEDAINVNPHIYVGEYFKSISNLYDGKIDSAFINSKKAFYGWPKNIQHYNNYFDVLEIKRDTTSLIEAFNFLSTSLKKNPTYFERFYKSFNKIKLSYLITKYEDLTFMPKDSIYGTWVRAYNFPNQVVYDSTLIYKFKKNDKLFDVDSTEYRFKLSKDSLSFLFKNNPSKSFFNVPIRYSPSYKTFILYNVWIDNQNNQTQYFRKVN